MGRVSTTAAFIRGSDINDRRDFHTFVSQLTKNMPAIEVLAWAPRVPLALRNAHEAAVRKEGFSKYMISQHDGQGRFVVAGEREEYYPILFAEPSPNNDSLLGLDIQSGAAGQAAISQARASGQATIAVWTALPGVKNGENLLLVLEPTQYESVATQITKRPADQPEADGFVLTVIRMEVMANKWLKLAEFNIPHDIDIYISANGKALASRHGGASRGLFQGDSASSTGAPTEPPVDGAMASEKFEVANANFTVVYVVTANYLARSGTSKPVIAMLTGLLITSLVAGYFWLLTGRMASVERQVADRWLELRERERYIRHLVDNTGDAIFLCDRQGTIVDVNKRACDNLGYSRNELLSMTVADVELPTVAAEPEPLAKHSSEEYPRSYESVHRRKDGTTFPVEVHLALVGIGAQRLVLAIVRDITDRKRAEAASSEK